MTIDFLSDTETVAAGESFVPTVKVFLSNPRLVKIDSVAVQAPDGWTVEP